MINYYRLIKHKSTMADSSNYQILFNSVTATFILPKYNLVLCYNFEQQQLMMVHSFSHKVISYNLNINVNQLLTIEIIQRETQDIVLQYGPIARRHDVKEIIILGSCYDTDAVFALREFFGKFSIDGYITLPDIFNPCANFKLNTQFETISFHYNPFTNIMSVRDTSSDIIVLTDKGSIIPLYENRTLNLVVLEPNENPKVIYCIDKVDYDHGDIQLLNKWLGKLTYNQYFCSLMSKK